MVHSTLPPHVSSVIDETKALMRQHVPEGPLLSLCEQRLGLLEENVHSQVQAPFIDAPYFLGLGFGSTPPKSRDVAVLCTLIYLGCDLLDDLHDHEIPQDKHSAAYASLSGILFLSSLAPLAIGKVFGKADPRVYLTHQLMAEGLKRMAGGQVRDIGSRFNPNLSAEEVEASAVAKSGEGLALFCHLSSLLSNQDEEVQKNCAQFGRAVDTALQIVSDLDDLLEKPTSNDLQEGTLTLPLALHFLKLEEKEKEFFCRVWRESAKSPEARRLLQDSLRQSGAVTHAALRIENYCAEARNALKSIPLTKNSQSALLNLIDKISCCGEFYQSHLKKTKAPVLMGM